MRPSYISLMTLAIVSCVCIPAESTEPSDADSLFAPVRQVFAERCFACHGPDVQESDLRLDERESATEPLDSGMTAIVPGDVDASELIARVTSSDESDRMPPEGDPLSAESIGLIKEWISKSAPYVQHWAYTDLDTAEPPDVDDETWVKNPIDRFVLAKLQSHGLTPSPRADRATLIKRLHYDLVGLPPTAEQAARFVQSDDPNAYETLVDSLLNSPHFGERWGRHWLDKARYADSDGYEKDRPRMNAWRYRDWVINAINDDMPMDRFSIEQLAGDLLANPTADQRLATAFHRQTLTNTEGGTDQEQFRVDAVFDRTETTGTVWLGLTIGCARCHSHKYDEISQDEYYRLFAFFNNGDEANMQVPTSDAAMRKYESQLADHERRRGELKQEIEQAALGSASALETWEKELVSRMASLAEVQSHDLVIESADASGGPSLERQKDNSFVVTGENPDVTEYSITGTLSLKQPMTGLRIDALVDDSLPDKGPGRAKNGNFVLAEIELEIDGKPVTFAAGRASFAQKNFQASNAVDGDGKTGWAVSPQLGKSHHATFWLSEPADLRDGTRLALRLRQSYGGQHTLGKFRMRAVTGDELEQIAPKKIRAIVETDPSKRTRKQSQDLQDHFLQTVYTPTKSLRAQLDKLTKQSPKPPLMDVRVIADRSNRRATKVLDRGDFLSPRDEVVEGGLGVLSPLQIRGDKPDRLDLARWLMDDANPLPSRVLANHVWAHLFGEGIVRTVNDFGVRGQPPTHPSLLDWLAAEYRTLGWSRKQFIKLIVMSATYQQSSRHREELSEIDAENRLLARQNRFRVPAEIVRDLCLSVSGLLSDKVGGPSVFPPLPADVASLSYANNFKWETSKGADRFRRGMYTFFKRTSPHPNLIAFDCPDSNTTNVARRNSNTPLQALTVLNNEVYFEASQALAARVLAGDASTDRQRVEDLLRICLVREASSFELDRFLTLLEHSRNWFTAHHSEAAELASRHQPEGFDRVEAAAWISVTRIALNLDEFITRE